MTAVSQTHYGCVYSFVIRFVDCYSTVSFCLLAVSLSTSKMEGVSDVPDMDDLLDKLEMSSEDFASPKISDHNGRADIKPVLYRGSEIRICPKDTSGNSLEKIHQKEERKSDQKVENSEEKRHTEEKFKEGMFNGSQKKCDSSSDDNKQLLKEVRGF